MSAASIATLNVQLQTARERLVKLTVRRDAVVRRDADRHWTETDSAIGSGIRRKPNVRADANRFARYDRDAQIFADHAQAQKRVNILESTLAHAVAERDRVQFTRDDIVGAEAVRTRHGWYRVAKVNQKTVTVYTEYSWTDRILFEKILEVRGGVS